MSWPSRRQPEEGFTLVEVLVALVITATALLVLAGTMYSAFGSIGFSRQRDTATELANQAMEQIRALNFSDLVMSVTDLSGDSLVTCGASCTFGSPPRTIPTVSSGALPPAPLYPHSSTTTPAVGSSSPGPATYTISSYLTFDPSGNTQARVATVRVSWNHPVKGASALVQIESTIFASGPLARGTGHAWSAQATDSPGNISVSGTLLGLNLAQVQFGPGSATAGIGVDSSATALGDVGQNKLQLLNQPLLSTPESKVTATSTAGQGIDGPKSDTQSDNGVIGQTQQSILNLIDVGQLGFTGGAGLTGTTKAIAASSAAGAANLSGQTMPNSSLPYAQGYASQTGPLSLGLNLSLLNLLGVTLGSTATSLISITPLGNGTPDMATVCQQSSPGAGCANALPSSANPAVVGSTGVTQPASSFLGPSIVAQAQKSFSDISVLPLLSRPLLQIKGFQAAASAAAGPGISNSGKASSTALSITVLGNPVPLGAGNILAPVSNATTTVSTVLGNLGVTANLTVGSATPSGNSALVTAPIALTVAVSLAGLLAVNITVNLGTVSASASYS